MHTSQLIEQLILYAQARELIENTDIAYMRNMLMIAMGMPAPDENAVLHGEVLPTATPILQPLAEIAVSKGLVGDSAFERDQFTQHLMNLLTPRPSVIIEKFNKMRMTRGAQGATTWFYNLCRANDYIRVDQIAKNIAFMQPSPYGELEITINLSKPEKDPKEIARAAKNKVTMEFPKCMLCIENEGYSGRPGYPSHEPMRIIPITLGGEDWRLQFSPYSYYPEHCIALCARHQPMTVSRRSFNLLLDFVDQFPHYFIGSNADLPIVGGSILSHDHFQGGHHEFPMDKAPVLAQFERDDFSDVRIESVRWPMTCLRLTSKNRDALVDLSDMILAQWRSYDDPSQDVYSHTDELPHNTVTPIARKLPGGSYVVQLVLRNNRTTAEHPLGIFHPHANLHHIKRENIGLIEVMGLFVLPGRLSEELESLSAFLTGARPMERPPEEDATAKHYDWLLTLAKQHGTKLSREDATKVLRDALTTKCVSVLEDAGVFKCTPEGHDALARFLMSMDIHPIGQRRPITA